ncbi:MAG TPA: flagellar biosynthesis protein FlhB [Firmicutes bacterium]|nr:flagellar biosynthesis protein FlhB [Bacillota bacterium]
MLLYVFMLISGLTLVLVQKTVRQEWQFEFALGTLNDVRDEFDSWRVGLMFFAAEGGDKTEKASPKKIKDARKKGQIPKSSDVNNFITLISAFGLVLVFGPIIIENVKDLMIYFLENSHHTNLIYSSSNSLLMTAINFYSKIIVLIFVPLLIAGVAANLVQTGFLLTGETMKPSFDKINPIKGLKNMFTMKRFFDFAKNVVKLVVVAYVSISFVKSHVSDLMKLPYMNYMTSLETLGNLTQSFILQIIILVGVIAAIDYGFQRFDFMRNLRMSKQELKEEYKQMEGDPFIKGKRRQKQREMAMSRMVEAVSDSTVIVTNPTHFAVAIKYDSNADMIPKVMAKGLDYKAQKIKELAKEYHVPIIENKPLARTLYRTVEIDDEIPVDLYQAVAEILAIVYKMERNKR